MGAEIFFVDVGLGTPPFRAPQAIVAGRAPSRARMAVPVLRSIVSD